MLISGEKEIFCPSERAFTPEWCSNFFNIIFSLFELKIVDGESISGISFLRSK